MCGSYLLGIMSSRLQMGLAKLADIQYTLMMKAYTVAKTPAHNSTLTNLIT
jgi:hypothetical protein